MSQKYPWIESALAKSPLSPEVSRVNRIALQENASHLVMSAIYGESSQESFAILNHDGSWQKTYQGCCQVSMDGFLDEYSGTWPEWGTMQAGECYPLSRPAHNISERGFALLPTPCASDGHAIDYCRKLRWMRNVLAQSGKSIHICYLTTLSGFSLQETIRIYETLMGFPGKWTSLDV